MKNFTTLLLLWLVMIVVAPVGIAKITDNTYNMRRARQALSEGNDSQAIDFLFDELDVNPDNALAHALIALSFFHLGSYPDAREAATQALDCFPEEMVKPRYGMLLLRCDINVYMGDSVEAFNDVNEAIRINPQSPIAYDRRGKFYCSQGRYEHARADYAHAVELDPEYSDGIMGLGHVALLTGEFDRAIELYNTTMALDPINYTAIAMRGRAYLGAGLYDKAMDDICTFLEKSLDDTVMTVLDQFPEEQRPLVIAKLTELKVKQPENIYPYICLAHVYELSENYAEAIQVLKDAQPLDQTGSNYIICNIGRGYLLMSEYESAITYFNQGLTIVPDDYYCLYSKATALGEIGREREAIDIFKRCIAEPTDSVDSNADVWYHIAFLEDNINETEAALADYDMVISLTPDYAYAHLGRADMLERLGRHDEALEAYQRVVELEPEPTANACAMYALLALGRKDEAVDFMQRMLMAYPDDAGTYYDAACFYSRMGQLEQSLQYLATALEKGFRRFAHIMRDDDLEAVRALPAFSTLMQQYLPTSQSSH